jgi:hypothetical protein
MTWPKISDDYSDDCWSLSHVAYRLHTDALVWNSRKLLDCRIPTADLQRVSPLTSSEMSAALSELFGCGWWTEDDDCCVIRHHAGYQRTKAQVLAQQATNTANGKKGGRPPSKPREQATDLASETESLTEPVTDRETESLTERERKGKDWALEEAQPTTQLRDDDACVTCGAATALDSAGQCQRCATVWTAIA